MATFWLLSEEVAFIVRRFGPGYRALSWADSGWITGTIVQEPAIMLVGALCIIALSRGTLACAGLVSRRWRPRPRSPRDTAPQTLVLNMALVFAVTTLLVIMQDLLGSQINFAAIDIDPQTGQSTLSGMLISAGLFLVFPLALMIGATWHAWRVRPQTVTMREERADEGRTGRAGRAMDD